MKKILIIKLGSLGDVIFSEGAIRDIKNHHPQDEITLLTAPFFAKLLNSHPCIDRIEIDQRYARWNIPYLYRLIMKLRRYGYDMVYDLQNNQRTNLYNMLLQPIQWSGKARWATVPYVQQSLRGEVSLDYLQDQLQQAGIVTQYASQPNWQWLRQSVTSLLNHYELQRGFILMLPGCSKRHPHKRWPGYVDLAKQLQARGQTVVCAPGPDELDLIDYFPGVCLLDNGKPLSIPQLIGLASHVQLVIGNDSGPTHLLARCQTKGIGIFQNEKYIHSCAIKRYYEVFCADPIGQITVDAVLARAMQMIATKAMAE